jgi:hypothetical protein
MSRTKDGVIPHSKIAVRMPAGAGIPRPGHSAPSSGEYELNGPRGGDAGKERAVARGKPLPPAPKEGADSGIHHPHNDMDKKK